MKIDRSTATAALLGGSIAAAAALGVPNEGMLQDTFKSAVVAFGTLVAALVFVWPRGEAVRVLHWHRALLLPLLLAVYALGSMAWSHTWVAGVEAVRWLLVALIALLALQVFREQERQELLAWCVVIGATAASVWLLLQFVFGLELFPQGARPGSTFVNRNFFAEFAVCALPFFGVLVGGGRRRVNEGLLSIAMGVVVVAVCMTGARAALVALGVMVVIGAIKTLDPGLRRDDKGAVSSSRRRPGSSVFWLCLPATIAVLGFIPTGDARIAAEKRGDTAITRAFTRTAAIASGDEATTMRLDMWGATARTIASHPLTGTGAGAWEHEADFHAHNEFLQLVAEYGLAGWLFLVGVAVWLYRLARNKTNAWRAALLQSLLALFIVSNAGFPWHLAATAAIFGLCLGALATEGSTELRMPRVAMFASTVVLLVALGAASYATWTAARAESSLARAARIALSIGAASNPNDPRWAPSRSEMLRLVDEGMRLHPAERQLTPIVADELGRWGDWPNAIRIWEHVLRSHPNVVVILTNVARGYIAIGRVDLATNYLERARRIQPDAPSVRAVDALVRQMSSSKG